jgi:hypothetical protein
LGLDCGPLKIEHMVPIHRDTIIVVHETSSELSFNGIDPLPLFDQLMEAIMIIYVEYVSKK